MTLYIHIPFCSSKCGYCAFHSVTFGDEALYQAYQEALILDLQSQLINQNYELSSIYFGGGTPNVMNAKFYEKIFAVIRKYAILQNACEITMEANPNLISKQWCQEVKSLGVNRMSLGVQSFYDEKLKFLQRDHYAYEIKCSVDSIFASGIENISIDLIYGTPLDTPQSLKRELQKVQSLALSHISAYALSLDEGSAFFKNPPKLPQDDLCFCVREELENLGFKQYEVSNFYKSAKSLHNLAYWQGSDYLGAGSGGVGCVGHIRTKGKTHLKEYLKDPLCKEKEILTSQEKRLERLFLGLRCEIGVEVQDLNSQKVQILLEEKKCKLTGKRLVAMDYFLADEIALFLS